MAQNRTPIEQVWSAKGNLPNNAIVATADGKYPALDGSLITGVAGSGDMNASVYDPTTIQADAFARVNHTGTQTASTISDFDTEVSNNTDVATNTAKVGITSTQASDITTNSSNISSNTTSIGYNLTAININTADIAINTAKVTYPSADSTKLSGIATGAEVNTINTALAGEPTGSDLVLNAVSLTQAEYDAGTPVATTFYIITA